MKLIEIIKELDVEVTKPNILQAIVAKQYDMNTRFLKVTLKDGGNRIDIPTIETAKVIINAERRDGLSKGFDGVINDDGTVTVPLHSWMLELDGTVICDISVIDTAEDNNKKLTTTSFTLLVEKATYGGDDVTNDPQYDVIVSLLETCTEASVAAQEALDKSNEANAKYEACVEATNSANKAADNANAVRQGIEEGGFIESLKELNNGSKFSFWVGTQAEYDAIEQKADNCFYLITDDNTVTDIKTKTDAISDYIVETGTYNPILYEFDGETQKGTSGATWLYRKWASGWAEIDGGIHIYGKYGFTETNGLYKSADSSRYGYPFKFVGDTHINATVGYAEVGGGGNSFWVSTRPWTYVSTCTPSFSAFTQKEVTNVPGETSSQGVHICVHIVGRWK